MSETQARALEMWHQITRSRALAISGAEEERLSALSDNPCWEITGRRQTLRDYQDGKLRAPLIRLLAEFVKEKATEGKKLRVVDGFTGHTDPLDSINQGIFASEGIPANSIEGFSFGLSFMGLPQERLDALSRGVDFYEADAFNPSDNLFGRIDRWRTINHDGQTEVEPIDVFINRLGTGDINFPQLPPIVLHRFLGEIYNRCDDVALLAFQIPQTIDDEQLHRYLACLQEKYHIRTRYYDGVPSDFQDNIEIYGRSHLIFGRTVVLLKKSESPSKWPRFRDVLEQMAA